MASSASRRKAQAFGNTSSVSAGKDNTLAAPLRRPGSTGGFSSAATSTASTDGEGDMTLSVDGGADRIKTSGSEDGNSAGSSQRRRMSRLFKKGSKSRRQSATPDDISPSQPYAGGDAPPLPDRPFFLRDREDTAQSEESLGLAKSVSSSQLTEDSDPEISPARRPSISQHNSHAGYLTLSSPLIPSEPIDSTASDPEGAPLTQAPTSPAAPDIKRTASPVNKLRSAFSPERPSKSPKPKESKEAPRPNTSGGGFGGLFGAKQRNKVLDDTSSFQESPSQLSESDAQSVKSLPTGAPKRIITQIPATPPNLGEAPTTFVTPPTPTDVRAPDSPKSSPSRAKSGPKHNPSQSNPNVTVSPSGNMISHRRARSATNPPSKLSNSISAPLTPHIEEVKTPGGTALPPQSSSGFFSSVFSAAQNAATSLTTTIANSTAGNKNKAGGQQPTGDDEKAADAGGEEVIGPENASPVNEEGAEKRRPAVETLGSGNLSLAQLGISDTESPVASAVNMSKMGNEASARAEDYAAAQAISDAYAREHAEPVTERARSLTTASAGSGALGAASPTRQADVTDSPRASSINRQGSIRSRISGGRKRRHRGSSATTGTAVGAAIGAAMGASTTTLAPQAALAGSRINGTGFAVAPPKRNRDFHNLFKSVPEDDYLIEDYSAALQKEILLQGRLYVSEGHLCFASNILGWVTNLIISFDEVVSVEKRSTAMLFPNGLMIQTLHARHTFASFLTRDATYDLIIGIWKISHPNLKSSLNGVTLDRHSGTGDKTEKAESMHSDDESVPESDDEIYDEDEEEDGAGSFTEAGEGSMIGSEMGSERGNESRKTSQVVSQAVSGGGAPKEKEGGAEAVAGLGAAVQDFPGPATHAPTDCGDVDQHYDKLLIDTTIPAPLGKIYSLMFGPASGVFMRKWLIDDQKSTDLQLEDSQFLSKDRKEVSFSYIKPLPGAIGPKQTKCLIKMDLQQFDLEKGVSVDCATQTPDVPSGNAFVTKTRYCLCWAPGNQTRVIMTFAVEWSGKSWLKGPIEKGANDGQISYANSLAAALRAAVAKPSSGRPTNGKGGRGKRRAKAAADEVLPEPTTQAAPAAPKKEANWGPLEPLRAVLGPVADILGGLLEQKFFTAMLLGLLAWSLFFRGPGAGTRGLMPHTPAERIVAYEQIWQREEAGLWAWMEERVALDRVRAVNGLGGERGAGLSYLVGEQLGMQERLKEEGMLERQVDEAIRVTEERLGVLKRAVERERGEPEENEERSKRSEAKDPSQKAKGKA